MPPCFFATSGTGLVSASRKIVTICSSLNRVFFMTPSLLRGRHSLKRQLVRNRQASHLSSRTFHDRTLQAAGSHCLPRYCQPTR